MDVRPGRPAGATQLADLLSIIDDIPYLHVNGIKVGVAGDDAEPVVDLDREAADVARDVGLVMTRAEAVNDDPLFLDMMADVVLRTIRRYATGQPLPLVAEP